MADKLQPARLASTDNQIQSLAKFIASKEFGCFTGAGFQAGPADLAAAAAGALGHWKIYDHKTGSPNVAKIEPGMRAK
jgi:hypothetical protein